MNNHKRVEVGEGRPQIAMRMGIGVFNNRKLRFGRGRGMKKRQTLLEILLYGR